MFGRQDVKCTDTILSEGGRAVIIAELPERREDLLNPTFGDYLKQWRKEAGLSMHALADKAQVSANYISIIENNKPHPVTGKPPEPSVHVVRRIAEACKIPEEVALRAAGFSASQDHAIIQFDERTGEMWVGESMTTLRPATQEEKQDELRKTLTHIEQAHQDVMRLVRALTQEKESPE
jgi:transcriptional regulator with XRE-family HTH domain